MAMGIMRRSQRGQSTAEYAILVSLVIASIVAMQTYVKRGLQGKVKDATDHVSDEMQQAGVTGTTTQYEPYYASNDFKVSQSQDNKTTVGEGQTVTRTVNKDTTERTGTSKQETDISKDDQWN